MKKFSSAIALLFVLRGLDAFAATPAWTCSAMCAEKGQYTGQYRFPYGQGLEPVFGRGQTPDEAFELLVMACVKRAGAGALPARAGVATEKTSNENGNILPVPVTMAEACLKL